MSEDQIKNDSAVASEINKEIQDENQKDEFNGRKNLLKWLNKQLRIEMTDGRILIGDFVCTDRDANIILSSSIESYNVEKTGITDEPRTLGLVMIPGRHVISIHYDEYSVPRKH